MSNYMFEKSRIQSYVGEMSSLAATTGHVHNMRFRADDCDRMTFLITAGTTHSLLGISTVWTGGIFSTVKLLQGSSAETATAAGLATANLRTNLGSTVAGTVQSAQVAYVACSSGKNGGNVAETVVLNGVTLTVGATDAVDWSSVSPVGAVPSTGTFGSSLLSTVDGGSELIAKGLANLINSTWGSSVFEGGLGAVFYASTNTYSDTTLQPLKIQIRDDHQLTSGITVVGSTGLDVYYGSQQAALAFNTALLNSTSKFVSLNFSSIGTSVKYTVTCIKEGVRCSPTQSTSGGMAYQGRYKLALNATDVSGTTLIA